MNNPYYPQNMQNSLNWNGIWSPIAPILSQSQMAACNLVAYPQFQLDYCNRSTCPGWKQTINQNVGNVTGCGQTEKQAPNKLFLMNSDRNTAFKPFKPSSSNESSQTNKEVINSDITHHEKSPKTAVLTSNREQNGEKRKDSTSTAKDSQSDSQTSVREAESVKTQDEEAKLSLRKDVLLKQFFRSMRRYYAKNCDISNLIQDIRKSADIQATLTVVINMAKNFCNKVLGVDDDTYIFLILLLDTKSRMTQILTSYLSVENELKNFIKSERISKLLRAYGDKKVKICAKHLGFRRLVYHYLQNCSPDMAQCEEKMRKFINFEDLQNL